MLQQQDLQLRTAMDDDTVARRLLDGLHQQVLFCRDSQLLGGLLGQYTAIATARCQTTAATDPLRAVAALLASIMKAQQDTAQAIINNLR